MYLNGAVYFARFYALRADVGFPDCSVIVDPYSLDISVPFSSRMPVRVRYIISGYLLLSANLTFSRHLPHLLLFLLI